LGFDQRGKVRLSMKAVDQQTGEDISKREDQPGQAAAAEAE
jgi:polyribonucleotide nucleotidyltransferase